MWARAILAIVLATTLIVVPITPALAAVNTALPPEAWCAGRPGILQRLCTWLIGRSTAPGYNNLFNRIRPALPGHTGPYEPEPPRNYIPVIKDNPQNGNKSEENTDIMVNEKTLPPIPKPGTLGGHVVKKIVGRTVKFNDRYYSGIIVMPGQPQGKLVWAFKIGQSKANDLDVLFMDFIRRYRSSLTFECQDIGLVLKFPLEDRQFIDRYAELVGINDPFSGVQYDYSLSPDRVRYFAARGAIDQSVVDLTRIPWGNPTRNVGFARQPTIALALLDAKENPEFVRALGPFGNLPAPGALYMNFVFVAEPGDKKWTIQSWNYAFEVDFRLTPSLNEFILDLKRDWRIALEQCDSTKDKEKGKEKDNPPPQAVPNNPPPDYPGIQPPNVPEPSGTIICRGRVIDPTKREDIYLCVDPKLIR